eukprot:6258416-Pyramimonas_sp.AAC.1
MPAHTQTCPHLVTTRPPAHVRRDGGGIALGHPRGVGWEPPEGMTLTRSRPDCGDFSSEASVLHLRLPSCRAS